jgi:hypothetical protein
MWKIDIEMMEQNKGIGVLDSRRREWLPYLHVAHVMDGGICHR